MPKSGMITIAGRSNVGKSTLLNALVGTKVAITSPIPQTTRQTIRGILNEPRGQIVFVDSPGIFESHRGPVTRAANRVAREALHGVDAVLYVIDPTRAIGSEEHHIHQLLTRQPMPKIVAYNKSDLAERERPYREQYHEMIFGYSSPPSTLRHDPHTDFVAEIDVSALQRQHLKPLLDILFMLLPEGEPLYDTAQFTDMPKAVWVAEIIREKVFLTMTEEIPYTVTVEVDEITPRKNGDYYIAARMVTTDARYRKMLIGAGGQRVKQIGLMARKELESATQHKVYLDLRVDVGDWVR